MSDVLVAFIIFQVVFFVLDIYIYTKMGRDIAREGEYKYFTALIRIHLLYLILNCLWTLREYDVIAMNEWMMNVLCMFSLISVAGCSFSFFMFTAEKIRFAPIRKKTIRYLCHIPVIVSCFLIIASFWTGWVFSINDSVKFIHGSLYLFMVFLEGLYLVAVVIIAGYHAVTAVNRQARRSSMALLASVSVIILFVILDDMLTKASLLPCAIFAVIVTTFILMQESNINSDALTGMNNRRKADDYLSEKISAVSEENPIYLYLGDLDDFKGINDRYGHSEGDEALMLCADALKRTVDEFQGFAARYGGDEFVLCCPQSEKLSNDPDAPVRRVNELLCSQAQKMGKSYRLCMTMGYTLCEDSQLSLSAYMMKADKMLYRRKKGRHIGRQRIYG